MKRLIITLALLLGLLGSGVAMAHAATPKTPAVFCSEDGCDGQQPGNCDQPIRVVGTDMIDSHGVKQGSLYLYKTTGASVCQYTAWGTVNLNTGFAPNYGLKVWSSRTSSGEVVNDYVPYAENGPHGYWDAVLLGWEPYPHAVDCFNGAVDWVDEYGQNLHTQTPQECFN